MVVFVSSGGSTIRGLPEGLRMGILLRDGSGNDVKSGQADQTDGALQETERKGLTHPGGYQQVTYFEEAQDVEQHLVWHVEQLSWGATLLDNSPRLGSGEPSRLDPIRDRLCHEGIGGVQRHGSGFRHGISCLLPSYHVRIWPGASTRWLIWEGCDLQLTALVQIITRHRELPDLSSDTRDREAGRPFDELAGHGWAQIHALAVHLMVDARPLSLLLPGVRWK